jgi:hypothetical protein
MLGYGRIGKRAGYSGKLLESLQEHQFALSQSAGRHDLGRIGPLGDHLLGVSIPLFTA